MKIPFIGAPTANRILCLAVGAIFIAHGAMRVYAGTVDEFGGFLQARGIAFGVAVAWGITFYELIGGALLALGRTTRPLAIIFAVHQIMAIILIHFKSGWFVVGQGSGGMEFSVLLIAALIAIAAQDR